jgi:hypothetical protein
MDHFTNCPDHGKRVAQTNKEKYGEDFYKVIGSMGKSGWKSDYPVSRLTESEVNRRLSLLTESGIDIYAYGWVEKVSKLWGISHTRVRQFFKTHWTGPKPYVRSSPR